MWIFILFSSWRTWNLSVFKGERPKTIKTLVLISHDGRTIFWYRFPTKIQNNRENTPRPLTVCSFAQCFPTVFDIWLWIIDERMSITIPIFFLHIKTRNESYGHKKQNRTRVILVLVNLKKKYNSTKIYTCERKLFSDLSICYVKLHQRWFPIDGGF